MPQRLCNRWFAAQEVRFIIGQRNVVEIRMRPRVISQVRAVLYPQPQDLLQTVRAQVAGAPCIHEPNYGYPPQWSEQLRGDSLDRCEVSPRYIVPAARKIIDGDRHLARLAPQRRCADEQKRNSHSISYACMSEAQNLPVVVIVGRPNVGKSTLFNAILGQRRSIVGDEPGITRDRIHGEATYLGRRFELIDTGGIIANDAEMIPSEILKQARFALDRAAHIIFLIDGRTEITAADRDLAAILRQLGKPVTLAVNKIDSQKREDLLGDFYALGFDNVTPVSAEHRLGLDDLLERATANFPTADAAPAAEITHIKVAIIGRPNVGKSTLLNALAGSERAIVSPIAGTTRDSVDETVQRDDVEYVFVDTAGIRRKGKTKLMAEKLSVVMARRSIRMAHVVVLVVDASEGLVALDATIAGYAHEEGRALIVCVNKWDITALRDQREYTTRIREEFKFLEYAPVIFVSAREGKGVSRLFKMIRECYEAASRRIGTGELNRFVAALELDPDYKIRYMTQASIRPPTFVVFTARPGAIHFSTERYLVNQLRKRFGFAGTPIVIRTRKNPGKEARR